MGTMRERSPGSWELTVSAGLVSSTGRYSRVIRTVRTGSKREAKAALPRLEVDVASGLEDPLMAELLDRWLAHLEDLGGSPSTLYGYRKYLPRELIPAIGAVRLSKLTAGHLDRLYSSLRREASADTRAHKTGNGVGDLRTRCAAEAAELDWTPSPLVAAVDATGVRVRREPVPTVTIDEVIGHSARGVAMALDSVRHSRARNNSVACQTGAARPRIKVAAGRDPSAHFA
jgi:Phage integrase, N-terminal SAM-like domain